MKSKTMPTTLLLLSAVLWESMQIKLASESKSSSSAETDKMML